MTSLRVAVSIALLATPFAASASGFLFGDNGARAMSMGGAFTGQADDLSAIQHNPAGLTQLRGFSFLLDGQGLNHDVSFQRKDADGRAVAEEVKNEGGVFFLPFVAASYGTEFGSRRFTASLGVYGPPAVGRYTYPEPNYTKTEVNGRQTYDANPVKYAPQRYGLVENDIIVLFPSLSAAYEVIPGRLSVGLSFQYVHANVMFRQAVTSRLSTPERQANEEPEYDSMVTVRQTGKPVFTGILGLLYKPHDRVQLGISYRPPVHVATDGVAEITLGEMPSRLTSLHGERANFSLTLPQELKVGVHLKPFEGLGVNIDGVYQGWQTVQEFVLTPEDIMFQVSGEDERLLHPFHIPKRWHHALSARVGAQYRFGFGLTVRAGALWEQSAVPDEYLHIDFAHFTRTFLTAGAEYEAGPVNIVLHGSFLPSQEKEILTSEVRQTNTDPGAVGGVIGNGTYRSGGWVVGLGIRGTFGGAVGPEVQ